MLWWKHVLTRKLKKIRLWLRQWRIAYVRQRMLSEGRVFLKAEFSRKPNFPKFPNCGFNTRHDNREATLIEFFESRICSNILFEYLPNVPKCEPKCELNTRHDNREVNREVTLIHLTRAQTLRSDKCATGSIHANGSKLSTLFHSNCSAAQDYVLHPGQFIFALIHIHSCKYYNPLSVKEDILKNFLCIWWWQILWWKHVLTKKL